MACEHLDRLGRPLGSDWAMSVYQVHDVDTFNRIPSVFGTGRCCQQWPAMDKIMFSLAAKPEEYVPKLEIGCEHEIHHSGAIKIP